MNLPGCAAPKDINHSLLAEIGKENSGVLSEASLREAARIEAEINLDGYEEVSDIVTACYLCHGQCSNFGVHGKSVRPCAKGVSSILARHRQARLDGRRHS